MTGRTNYENLHLDQIIATSNDISNIINELTRQFITYPKEAVKLFNEFNKEWCGEKLDILEKLFNKYSKTDYILGNKVSYHLFYIYNKKLTWADFFMYDAFDFHRILFPECLENHQRLYGFYKTMDQLSAIKIVKKTIPNMNKYLLQLIQESRK